VKTNRDHLDFIIVGGIGVGVLIYLVAAIPRDLGLFSSIPFYFRLPPETLLVFLWVLGLASVLLLPIGFYLERKMVGCRSARRTWHTFSVRPGRRSVKVGTWQVRQAKENRNDSNDD
jgi:hypothetical protein